MHCTDYEETFAEVAKMTVGYALIVVSPYFSIASLSICYKIMPFFKVTFSSNILDVQHQTMLSILRQPHIG